MRDFDLVIIGAGPAGLTSALYGSRAGLSVAVLEHQMPGGQANLTFDIDNLPSNDAISGFALSKKMRERAESFGAKIIEDKAISIDAGSLIVSGESGTYQAKAIILATGAEHRKLGMPSEERFAGRGISYCAACDGAFFKGKKVLVIGGGNSAFGAAVYLSKISNDVAIVSRRDRFRADRCLVKSAKDAGVKLVPDLVPFEFRGGKSLASAVFKDRLTGETKELPAEGVFIYVGISPNVELAKAAGIELDDSGYIRVDCDQATSKEGIFAAGDVCGGIKQIVAAWGTGATAAIRAFEFITSGRH